MSDPFRHRLPTTRRSVTRRIEHVGDLDIYVTVGFYDNSDEECPRCFGTKLTRGTTRTCDGCGGTGKLPQQDRPGEVFVNIGKEGSTLGGLADWAAVLMSLALQYGVPWDVLAAHARNTNFDPRNEEGKSIAHAVVTAVDEILAEKFSTIEKSIPP